MKLLIVHQRLIGWFTKSVCQVHRVDFNESGESLNWPVLLCYPSVGETDFIQSFNENITFEDQLSDVLKEPAPWDKENNYTFV